MPLNVRKIFAAVILSLFGITAFISAQTAPQANQTTPAQTPITSVEKQPTSAEVMRDRISKAKAFIAVRNYNAAIYELENIRRETSDQSVNAVANVLLMNSYLEQGDYRRAQAFLDEFFKSYKSNSAMGNMYYSSVAAQVIKGARNQVERYRALGLNVADRNLPLEAVNDVERMRETLEAVITQAKELGADKSRSAAAMAILEEATNSRAMIARDDYDARRWQQELVDSREQIASSRSVIVNAVDGSTVPNPVSQATIALNTSANQPVSAPVNPVTSPAPVMTDAANRNAVTMKPVPEPSRETPPQIAADTQRNRVIDSKPVVETPQQVQQNVPQTQPQSVARSEAPAGPLDVGSLIAFATEKQAPVYPPAARSMRASGVVKVEITIDESGQVAEVQKMTGPSLLQSAAKDAIRRWKFKPFMRDGQPVRATGFVNFNFSL